jgi:hypothetical protein
MTLEPVHFHSILSRDNLQYTPLSKKLTETLAKYRLISGLLVQSESEVGGIFGCVVKIWRFFQFYEILWT